MFNKQLENKLHIKSRTGSDATSSYPIIFLSKKDRMYLIIQQSKNRLKTLCGFLHFGHANISYLLNFAPFSIVLLYDPAG